VNLDTYKTLTGLDVAASNEAFVTANIARTQAMLEVLLGFTLNADKVMENKYDELGQSSESCVCPNFATSGLTAADFVNGAYRLYGYNKSDKYLHIDPATNVYNVKLVWVRNGLEGAGVTLTTFEPDTVNVQFNNDGFITYINNVELIRSTLCDSDYEKVQLAVDGDWLWEEDIPADLLYVWTDMITYYSDKKHNVKSESIDSHSYSLGEVKVPQAEDYNIAILKKYAGPKGSITRTII